MIKHITEYKFNLYNFVLTFGFVIFISTIFAYFISNNFSNTINWQFYDFLLLTAFSGIFWGIYGTLGWVNRLQYNIVSGRLNLLLIRPMSIPIKYYFYKMAGGGFTYLLQSVVYLVVISFYFNIKFANYMHGILIFILILSFFVLLLFAIDSFNLLYLGLGSQLEVPFSGVNNQLTAYPAQFFSTTKLKYLLHFAPLYFISSLLIPTVRDYQTTNFSFQIYLLMSLIILSILILKINWHYGLKKYEAFG